MASGEDLIPLARDWRVPLVRLSRRAKVGPQALINLWHRLHLRPPDLLVFLTVVPNIWGRVLGCLARVPVLVGSCRGGGAAERQHEGWLWPLAHHILSNSEAMKTELTVHCRVPEALISVIPNGVDTAWFRPPAAPYVGPPRVICVARMVPAKDHETLIRAFGLMVRDHPTAELCLVGDGPRLAAIEGLAAKLLPPGRFRFLPGQADIRPLLHRADLLALSSRQEALPNVVLEAMAAGLAVVATRVGGVPELVVPGVTGWLVEPGDAPALAAAMGQLIENPGVRQAMGRAGRERALRKFSLETMTHLHEEVLDRLLAQARA